MSFKLLIAPLAAIAMIAFPAIGFADEGDDETGIGIVSDVTEEVTDTVDVNDLVDGGILNDADVLNNTEINNNTTNEDGGLLAENPLGNSDCEANQASNCESTEKEVVVEEEDAFGSNNCEAKATEKASACDPEPVQATPVVICECVANDDPCIREGNARGERVVIVREVKHIKQPVIVDNDYVDEEQAFTYAPRPVIQSGGDYPAVTH